MTHKPTPEQVNAFKAAWHDADDNGQAGKRVEIALAAVLGPALAEAWDRGHGAPCDEWVRSEMCFEYHSNPYR